MSTADPSALFALALERMDGVGRVTAGRLLDAFPTLHDLRRYPREQVLARIKGAPNAQKLIARLFDDQVMTALHAEAEETVSRLKHRRIDILTPYAEGWPVGLGDLPRARRPVVLYAFGAQEVLYRPIVALLAPAKLMPAPFEQAQALVRYLLQQGIVPATGASTGFDIVVHKLSAMGPTPHPSLLVAPAGMARVQSNLRPSVSAAVRAGGLFLSPFAMNHGPFDHDNTERALVLAALADACIFVAAPPKTPEHDAMTWALEAGRSVFGFRSETHPLPEGVHPLHTEADFEWVAAAAG